MQKNICLALYDPKFLCFPFQQTTDNMPFFFSPKWFLVARRSTVVCPALICSKTEDYSEVKRGAKHSIGHESQVVSNMSTLFPVFLWKLLFLLMMFLFSWSLKDIQRNCEKFMLLKSPLRGTKKERGDFETYSWGHSGSNVQLNE